MRDTIVLWDIDNTLLYTGGAGSLGMARAFRDLYGVEDAFRRIEFSGRTDAAILRDATVAHSVGGEWPAEMLRFVDAYVPHLRAALGEVTGGRLMPGVAEALAALASEPSVVSGLGTGNFRRGGQIKLDHFGLGRYFPGVVGGFGEDAEDRAVVIGTAITRLLDGAHDGARVVVIGDTPHDVAAAKANGAVALAVATGRDSTETLLAAGADHALEDLSDLDRVMSVVLGR